MNVITGFSGEDPRRRQLSLVACCRYVAERAGEESFAGQLEQRADSLVGTNGKETLDRVSQMAREAGLRAVIQRPRDERLLDSELRLPGIAESREGDYFVIAGVEEAALANSPGFVVLHMRHNGEVERKLISASQLKEVWTGGVLIFKRVNTALACFTIIAREHKIEVTPERLSHEYQLDNRELSGKVLLRMSKDLGMKAKSFKLDVQALMDLEKAYPLIARMHGGRHVVVVGIIRQERSEGQEVFACYDPLSGAAGGHVRLSLEEFESQWSGHAYILKRGYKLSDDSQPFGLRWFIPELLKQKVAFIDIALGVLFINLIGLVTPLFFQIVIDKVLVNQAFTTLHVLGVGLIAMLVANGVLDYLRDHLLLHATNKVDLQLTTRTFRHMLSLPLVFFERMTAGVLTKHMQQTVNIRGFLTGSVFLTMLEATTLFVFLPVMFFYSLLLTAVVVAFALIIATVMFVLIAPFKRRLNALYDAEGKRQGLLVEAINGIPTIKAMAIEPMIRSDWEEKVARAISMRLRVGKISITARSLSLFLERVMIVILIWVGVHQVFSGAITVGGLIAFQMLAGRVTSPLVRLVALVHEYQEAALSVDKLGTVMNTKPEWGTDRHGSRPSLKGDIVFKKVSFRYGPDLPDALKDISLTIPFGKVLGVVGPSGSGKTTFTRLLQKIYFPTSGTIRIENYNLNDVDTPHLRSKMGVVLQENFLFRATVADNIRAGQAGASRDEIIEASVLAGADEFILHMPHGYDTMLEEGASNMSGGQRQRLAIARALLTRPDILILDEATSSLDPESEQFVRMNLERIAYERTLIIVSHRLSMLKNADNIIVLDKGRMVSHGTHRQLLESCDLYSKLWRQQMELDEGETV